MKKHLLGLLFPLLLLSTAFEGPFQGDADQVIAALKSGNASEIAKHFAVVVDIKFLNAPEDKIVATEKRPTNSLLFIPNTRLKDLNALRKEKLVTRCI